MNYCNCPNCQTDNCPNADWNVGALMEQNKLLKELVAYAVEMLPKHSVDCGVHKAHPSYGDKYCSCKMPNLRKAIRSVAN